MKKSLSGKSRKDQVPTSWGAVASWYDRLLEERADSYQRRVILPNLLRLLGQVKGRRILDIGAGQGFFSREMAARGALVTGIDAAEELVALAKERAPAAEFIKARADQLPFSDGIFDAAMAILALQNMENLNGVIFEAGRVIKATGRLLVVINHPAFRVPKRSSWGFDEEKNIQFRRIDGYLSDARVFIEMNPGSGGGTRTISFHRPLQTYFKILAKNNFVVRRLEEWISPKVSQPGPRQAAEDKARKEFPLFLYLEAVKISYKILGEG
jgi:ubiquinone/menaquinone biosynthesis C-methylase UbiE